MSTISKFLPNPPDNFSTQIATTNLGSTDLSVDLDSTTGLASEGVGQFFKKNAEGEVVAGSIEFVHWTGKAGNTITFTDTGDRGIAGSDSGAQAYVADDWFEVWVSSYYQPTDGILVEHNSDGTHDTAVIATLTGTQTLENKAIKPRIVSITSSSAPTPNADTTDIYLVTALAEGATLGAPTGTLVQGQKLIIRIKDNGSARTLGYNSVYRAIGVDLPTTTVISKTIYLGGIYNSTDSKWDIVAVAEEE